MFDERKLKLVARLPTEARQQVVKLRTELDGLFASQRELGARRNDVRDEIESEKFKLNQILAERTANQDESRITMFRESIASKSELLLDIDAAMHEGTERRQTLAALIGGVLDFLQSVPADKMLQPVNRPPAALRKGETIATAVERCRARISEMKRKRSEIEMAPLPAATIRENAKSEIERLAERGRPVLTAAIERGEPIEWPRRAERLIGSNGGHVDQIDVLGMLAWLHRDALLAALDREIGVTADDEGALAPDQRAAAIKTIADQMDEVERDEVSFIEQAADNGSAIGHRPDISIAALLGLADKLVSAPKQPQAEPLMRGEPRSRHVEAPLHGSSLPEPAKRDAVWQ